MRPRDTRTPEQLLDRVQHAAEIGSRDQHDALAALEQLVAKRPRSAQLWNTLARARIAAGDYRGALAAAREAIARSPNDPAYGYINAGIASRELGDLVAAGRFFSKAVARAEHDPLAHYQCAKTFHAAGRTYAAATAYIEAIAHAAERRDDITALAIAGLGDLAPIHPSLPTHLCAFIDAARAISVRSGTSVRLHIQRIFGHTTDAVAQNAALAMFSHFLRNRERTPRAQRS